MNATDNSQDKRRQIMKSVQDAMDVLNGKWKVAIISSLCCFNQRRFTDILNDVTGISTRMLSKELKELEINQLITRTILDTSPITVQYELTAHGKTLQPIIKDLASWGVTHRKQIVGR
ncbi:helix-turn-helix domain-containing protein [Spirosoma knui]